ncbi:MAG: hypothetical protein ACE14L_05445 [Terriglobales bacterium]
MSAQTTLSIFTAAAQDAERGHRMRLYAAIVAAAAVNLALAIYGFDYYLLDTHDRPFSPKHLLLRPSGVIGIKLGVLGVAMFCVIFLYPLRKRISRLGRIGKTKHWLDFHIVLGLSAPVIIAFHSSFKFNGIAGMAFWIMVAVALSGVAGRYIYAQVPRSLSSAELSLRELQAMEAELTGELAGQTLLPAADLAPLFQMPGAEKVRAMPLHRALLLILGFDLRRPWQIAQLRARVLGRRGHLPSLGGLLRPRHEELDRVVTVARRKASLVKRIAFLERSQQVLHLWHVIHRPFSYSMVVLAAIHIGVVLALGYL